VLEIWQYCSVTGQDEKGLGQKKSVGEKVKDLNITLMIVKIDIHL
jgi:hypothetical protein